MANERTIVVEASSIPPELRTYARSVWPQARDDAMRWRREAPARALVRDAAGAEALWWAAIDGAFEATGGVLDLAFRARVLDAVIQDSPRRPVTIVAPDGDPWHAVVTCVARTRGGDVRSIATGTRIKQGDRPVGSRLALLSRAVLGRVFFRERDAEVMVVLTHGRMATRRDGIIADRYTTAFLGELRRRHRVSLISLAAPFGVMADLGAVVAGQYTPWLAPLSPARLAGNRASRERWRTLLVRADAFDVHVGELTFDTVALRRPLDLAARGLALAQLYREAFAALGRRAPKVAIATEGHGNVGKMLRVALPSVRLLAPQAGIIAPDGSTNSAYDHRGVRLGLAGYPAPHRSLLWGPYYRDVLQRLGHDAATTAVVGLPRAVPDARRARGRGVVYVAGANDDVLEFASSFGEEIAVIRCLQHALGDRDLTVRLHPGHDAERYRAAVPSGVRISDPARRSLGADLADCCLVVGKSSTALVESAAAGRPVLVANLGPTPDLTGLKDAGLPYVEDENALAGALPHLFHAPPPAIDHLVSATDDQAVEHLLDEVNAGVMA